MCDELCQKSFKDAINFENAYLQLQDRIKVNEWMSILYATYIGYSVPEEKNFYSDFFRNFESVRSDQT